MVEPCWFNTNICSFVNKNDFHLFITFLNLKVKNTPVYRKTYVWVEKTSTASFILSLVTKIIFYTFVFFLNIPLTSLGTVSYNHYLLVSYEVRYETSHLDCSTPIKSCWKAPEKTFPTFDTFNVLKQNDWILFHGFINFSHLFNADVLHRYVRS